MLGNVIKGLRKLRNNKLVKMVNGLFGSCARDDSEVKKEGR